MRNKFFEKKRNKSDFRKSVFLPTNLEFFLMQIKGLRGLCKISWETFGYVTWKQHYKMSENSPPQYLGAQNEDLCLKKGCFNNDYSKLFGISGLQETLITLDGLSGVNSFGCDFLCLCLLFVWLSIGVGLSRQWLHFSFLGELILYPQKWEYILR